MEVVSKTACMYVVIKYCGMWVSAKIESVMDTVWRRLTGKQTEHLVRVTSEEVGAGHSECGRFGMSVCSGLE